MIAILSPAKNMRARRLPGLDLTRPGFPEETDALVRRLRTLTAPEMETLMRVNPEIALGACIRYREFDPKGEGTAALLAYSGLAYAHVGPEEFDLADFAFLSDRLRILSALYGLLRPTDGIMPYRLEMGCRLDTGAGNLYRFWGDKLYRALFAPGDTVVNLASGEYSRAVTPYLTAPDRMVTCRFLVFRDGRYRTLATEAKMCRGEMVRMMVQNRLTEPRQLRDFDWGGYRYIRGMSGETEYTFVKC